MMFSYYFVKQNNGDGAENVVGARQDQETGTGDRRMRIQRDETGKVVGDRQDQETGTKDRRTRIQRDEAGNVVGDRQDRETGTEDRRKRIQKDEAGNVGNRQDWETGNRRKETGARRIAGETCMNQTAKTIWHQGNSAFQLLPSRQRLKVPKSITNHYRNSFVPAAII
jgi:hypothetical protein